MEKKAIWNNWIIWALLALFGFGIFSKENSLESRMEYRPIVVTSQSRALNTAYQPSLSRFTLVSCSVNITSTLSLSGGQSGTITLQSSPDNVTYTTIATATNNNTGSLTLGLNTSQAQSCTLTGTISPGYYYKLTSTGTSTFSILQTFETNL